MKALQQVRKSAVCYLVHSICMLDVYVHSSRSVEQKKIRICERVYEIIDFGIKL